MKKYPAYFSFVLLFAIASCTSSREFLARGDYYNATLKSAEKLKTHPNNKKAFKIFSKSYPITLGFINLNIESLSTAPYDDNLQRLKTELQKINTLSELFNSSNEKLSPYGQPMAFLQNKAAQKAVEIGEQEFSKRSRKGLLQEYNAFKDISFLSKTSYAEFLKTHTIHALYEERNTSDSSNRSFQSTLIKSVNTSLTNITPHPGQEAAEQLITIDFHGFKMDSLIVTNVPYGSVTAVTLPAPNFSFRYTIVVRCEATVTIVDAKTKAVLLTTEIEGKDQWVSRAWYKFNAAMYLNPRVTAWNFRYSPGRLDEIDLIQSLHRYKHLYRPANEDLQRKLIGKLNEFYNL